MENIYKRRTYFIEKAFQAKFIIKFCLLIIAASCFFSALVYLLSQQTVTTAFENSRLVIKSTADFILPVLILSSAISAGLICLATIAVVLFISHKIAGPVYRFQKAAKAVSDGDLSSELRIRKNDQLQPLAASLDEMISSMRGKINEIKDLANQIENNQSNSRELSEKISSLKRNLNFFKT